MEPKIKYSSVPSLMVSRSCSGSLCGSDDLICSEYGNLTCPTCGTHWHADNCDDGDEGEPFIPGEDGEYADDAREFDL